MLRFCISYSQVGSQEPLVELIVPGEGCPSKWQNGSMHSVTEKAYETWLIRPNQEHKSLMMVGVGKSWIMSRYFLHDCTLLGVILNPANLTVSSPNTNLSGLRMMP